MHAPAHMTNKERAVVTMVTLLSAMHAETEKSPINSERLQSLSEAIKALTPLVLSSAW